MKTQNISLICLLALSVILTSCKKESDNIFNMFTDVTVTFHDDHPDAVTDYKLLNDGDNVRISYTISSPNKDMYKVIVDSTDATGNYRTAKTILTTSDERRSYSGVISFKMMRDNKTTFRVFALDSSDTYLGDGYKKVTVEGRASYTLHSNRVLFANVDDKNLPTYYSISRGEVFSYNDAKANSKDIDFGISVAPRFYNLLTIPNPVPDNDISDWEKRETLFSSPVGGAVNLFNTTLISSSKIEEEAKKRTINLNTINTNLAASALYFFRTPEGKYGAILVHSIVNDYLGRRAINFSVKTQK